MILSHPVYKNVGGMNSPLSVTKIAFSVSLAERTAEIFIIASSATKVNGQC